MHSVSVPMQVRRSSRRRGRRRGGRPQQIPSSESVAGHRLSHFRCADRRSLQRRPSATYVAASERVASDSGPQARALRSRIVRACPYLTLCTNVVPVLGAPHRTLMTGWRGREADAGGVLRQTSSRGRHCPVSTTIVAWKQLSGLSTLCRRRCTMTLTAEWCSAGTPSKLTVASPCRWCNVSPGALCTRPAAVDRSLLGTLVVIVMYIDTRQLGRTPETDWERIKR